MFGLENFKIAPQALAGAAAAAALSLVGFAAPAEASSIIYLKTATMNTTFQANIQGVGAVYSNGVTFKASNTLNGPTYDLYGFCIDIFHDMYINTTLNYQYVSTYGDPGQLLYTNYGPTAPANQLNATQIQKLTDLIDTGWMLHQAAPTDFNTAMKTAAIQAAIWTIANPTRTITLSNANLNATQFNQYQGLYNNYVAGNFTPLNDANDKVYTITDIARNPQHQTFAIGWPVDGVPEPGAWALMITGFGAAGLMLRRQRAALAA